LCERDYFFSKKMSLFGTKMFSVVFFSLFAIFLNVIILFEIKHDSSLEALAGLEPETECSIAGKVHHRVDSIKMCHRFRLTKRDDYFQVTFCHFWNKCYFWDSWGLLKLAQASSLTKICKFNQVKRVQILETRSIKFLWSTFAITNALSNIWLVDGTARFIMHTFPKFQVLKKIKNNKIIYKN